MTNNVVFAKDKFVDIMENIVKLAFHDYRGLIEMGYSEADAIERAIEETRESAICFAGIGTCGTGGCKH